MFLLKLFSSIKSVNQDYTSLYFWIVSYLVMIYVPGKKRKGTAEAHNVCNPEIVSSCYLGNNPKCMFLIISSIV